MTNLLNDIESQGLKLILSADLSAQMLTKSHGNTNRYSSMTISYHQLDLDSWFFSVFKN